MCGRLKFKQWCWWSAVFHPSAHPWNWKKTKLSTVGWNEAPTVGSFVLFQFYFTMCNGLKAQSTQVALRRGPYSPKRKCLKWPPKLTTGPVGLSYSRRQTVLEPRCSIYGVWWLGNGWMPVVLKFISEETYVIGDRYHRSDRRATGLWCELTVSCGSCHTLTHLFSPVTMNVIMAGHHMRRRSLEITAQCARVTGVGSTDSLMIMQYGGDHCML